MTLDATVANTDRLYALDSLRATMMLLGIVLHTVISYLPISLGPAWSYQDESQTIWALVVFVFIHAFRMQVFFVIAGFFSALLLDRRGTGGLVRSRLERIALPLIVALFLLWPLIVAGFVFANSGVEGVAEVPATAFLVPMSMAHLWFLNYLLYYYAGALILVTVLKLVPENVRRSCANGFGWLLDRPLLRVFVLGLITASTLLPVDGILLPSTEFLPAFLNLLFYFVYFMFGWFLYQHRDKLQSFTTGAWPQTIAAAVLFLSYTFIVKPELELSTSQIGMLTSLVQGLSQWMFVFGITGLFIRYLDRPSARIRYIVDASYWVYLVHLPVVITASGLFANSGISVWLKMPIVMLITTVVGFATYDWFVRSSIIGRVLNGRRYPRGLPVTQPVGSA